MLTKTTYSHINTHRDKHIQTRTVTQKHRTSIFILYHPIKHECLHFYDILKFFSLIDVFFSFEQLWLALLFCVGAGTWTLRPIEFPFSKKSFEVAEEHPSPNYRRFLYKYFRDLLLNMIWLIDLLKFLPFMARICTYLHVSTSDQVFFNMFLLVLYISYLFSYNQSDHAFRI
jgi:hypothetical protein